MMEHHNRHQFQSIKTIHKFSSDIKANGHCKERTHLILFYSLYNYFLATQHCKDLGSQLYSDTCMHPQEKGYSQNPTIMVSHKSWGPQAAGINEEQPSGPRIRMAMSRFPLSSCLLGAGHSSAWLENPTLLYYHCVQTRFVKLYFNLVKSKVF